MLSRTQACFFQLLLAWSFLSFLVLVTFAEDGDRPNSESLISARSDESNANQYFIVGGDGEKKTYSFGFDSIAKDAPRLLREEIRRPDGTVVGRYGYTDPFGVFRIVKYVAGPHGYYATEDIGGTSSSSNKNYFFKATARQVDGQVVDKPQSLSHQLATKFNPPLYHPEAHLVEAATQPQVRRVRRIRIKRIRKVRVSR